MENVAKIAEVQKAPRNENSVGAIAWFVGVTIYRNLPFFNNNLPPARQVLLDKIL